MDQLAVPAVVCLLLLVIQAGVAQEEPSCSVEIREPIGRVLTGQRTWLECHLQGQWQGLTCTLNGERNRIHSSLGRHRCQLDIMAKTVGTNLVHCTVFCVDGSTSNSTINMTVIATGTPTPVPSPTSSEQAVQTSTDNPQSTATPTHPTDKDGIQPDSDKGNSVLLRVIVPVGVGGALVAVVVVVVVATLLVIVYKRNTAKRKRTTS